MSSKATAGLRVPVVSRVCVLRVFVVFDGKVVLYLALTGDIKTSCVFVVPRTAHVIIQLAPALDLHALLQTSFDAAPKPLCGCASRCRDRGMIASRCSYELVFGGRFPRFISTVQKGQKATKQRINTVNTINTVDTDDLQLQNVETWSTSHHTCTIHTTHESLCSSWSESGLHCTVQHDGVHVRSLGAFSRPACHLVHLPLLMGRFETVAKQHFLPSTAKTSREL